MVPTAKNKSKKYLLWIGVRQLASKKGNNLSFMTWTSILGITIGVAALIIVMSVMAGLGMDLKSKMFKGLPHLEILAHNKMLGFSLKELSIEKVRNLFPEATGVEPFTQADVILKRGKHLASVTLFGIDPQKGGKLWGFSQGMVDSENIRMLSEPVQIFSYQTAMPGIILGEGLAVQLGASVGDTLRVLTPQINLSNVLGGAPVSREFRVLGLFNTDLIQFDQRYAVVSLNDGRKFMPDYDESLDTEEYVTGISVNFRDPEKVNDVEARIKTVKDVQISTWKDANKSLLFALWLEKFTMGAILFLIVLVAAFSICGTLMMTVNYRRGQIALLRCLGMTVSDIKRLYIFYGSAIGFLGVMFGFMLGLLVCVALYYFQFIPMPSEAFYQKQLPVKFLPLEYGIICIMAWILSLIASIYPAIIASKQDPGEGLRCL